MEILNQILPEKSTATEVLSNVVQSRKESSNNRLPAVNSENYLHRGSPNIVVSTESLNSDDTSGSTSTKDIKKVFVLGNSMVKHVQEWDITKRIENKVNASEAVS